MVSKLHFCILFVPQGYPHLLTGTLLFLVVLRGKTSAGAHIYMWPEMEVTLTRKVDVQLDFVKIKYVAGLKCSGIIFIFYYF